MTKTLNKLRQDPFNGRSTALHAGTTSSRPMTNRSTSHQNTNSPTTSNFFYPLSGGTKGPLPAELMTRRSSNLLPTNTTPNGVSHGRISNGTGALVVQHHEIKSTDSPSIRAPTPFRVQTKSLDSNLHQTDRLNFNTITIDNHYDRNRVNEIYFNLLFYLLLLSRNLNMIHISN